MGQFSRAPLPDPADVSHHLVNIPADVRRALQHRARWLWRLIFWPIFIPALWLADDLAQRREWAFWLLGFFAVWVSPWLPSWYFAGQEKVEFWLELRAARHRAARGFWPGSGQR